MPFINAIPMGQQLWCQSRLNRGTECFKDGTGSGVHGTLRLRQRGKQGHEGGRVDIQRGERLAAVIVRARREPFRERRQQAASFGFGGRARLGGVAVFMPQILRHLGVKSRAAG